MRGRWVVTFLVSAVMVCACQFAGAAANGGSSLPHPATLADIQYPYALDTGGHTALVVDPFAVDDPAEVWNDWRSENMLDRDPPLMILQAHDIWARFHSNLQCPQARSLEPVPYEEREESFTASPNVPIGAPVLGEDAEIFIAVDPNNASHVFAACNHRLAGDATCASVLTGSGVTVSSNGGQEVYWSLDGGSTWSHQCAPWPAALAYTLTTSNGTSPFQFQASDPSIGFDASGNAYLACLDWWQDSTGTYSGNSVDVIKWTASSNTWSGLAAIRNDMACTSTTCSSDDKTMLAIDSTSGQTYSHTNRIYVAFERLIYSGGWTYTAYLAYADPPYTSWTSAAFSPAGAAGSYPRLPAKMLVGADGTVYYTWDRVAATGSRQVISLSTDGGSSWSTAVNMSTTASLTDFATSTKIAPQDTRGIALLPSVAIDTGASSPYKGYIYEAYTDYHSGGSGANVDAYVRRSINNGTTWAQVAVFTGGSTFCTGTGTCTSGNSTAQFEPTIAVDPSTGIVTAAWYDTNIDPTNNRLVQVYSSQSTDGGTTWSTPQLVTDSGLNYSNHLNYLDENSTDMPSVTTLHHYQYGEYMSSCALNGKTWIGWTDSRNWLTGTPTDTEFEDLGTSWLCTNPGAPTITSITDNDPCVQDGIHVNFSAGSGASSYNLLKDSVVVVTGYTSGALYNPGNSSSHTYIVQSVSGSCTTNSTGSAFADAAGPCSPPGEAAPGSNSGNAQSWTSGGAFTSWPSVTSATSYSLYRGIKADLPQLLNSSTDSCTKYNGSLTSAAISDDPTLVAGYFYWYLVTASNSNGEGTAGNATAGPRVVNSSGTCP